ncbi:hypothetical protein [Fulvivirga lutea]|uniref:Uncharacterized protein n=1 Tax=Fulvivirga lutea TaxID=2810512 RepID=A0A974WH72_9BACT|nr:hypothetical protein [Fulvivirga lutea]QSE97162.1 hypothetical protein JR347_16450 [Fulvivirga lutea]
MKKTLFNLLLFSLLAFACSEAPEFPNTPKIEFNNIIFKDLGDDADSLIVLIDFEDGDGDLGLGSEEVTPPFNQKNYFSNKTGQFFDFGNETLGDLLRFANRAEIDTLPDFVGDAKCLYWDTSPDIFLPDGTELKDTVYFQFNERHYNFLVEFFIDNGSGFEEYDWRIESGDCSPSFDGRFPILNESGKEKAIEGTIRYGMPSFGFETVLGDRQVKLAITIIDRRGNYSNRIETPPFRLSEID